MKSLPGVVEQKSLKVQWYSDFGEDVLYRIEQRALPVAHLVEVVP
jgi:hypothetical protein